jgi:hypothetical protein
MSNYVYLQEFNSVVQPRIGYPDVMNYRDNTDGSNRIRHDWHGDAVTVYKQHLLSLPRYELIGQHSFKDRQELIEGKDFTWYYPNKVGEPSMVALVIPEKFKTPPVFVAVPTQGKQTGDQDDACRERDEWKAQAKALSAIKKGLEKSLDESLKQLAALPASDADNQNELWEEVSEGEIVQFVKSAYHLLVQDGKETMMDFLQKCKPTYRITKNKK